MEDYEIIDLYWERNSVALTETHHKYGTRLMHLAKNMVSLYEDAEECVNDTYLGAWNSMPPKRPDYLFAYLAKICRNLCCNYLDKKTAKKRKAEIVELTSELELCIPHPQEERRAESEEIGAVLSAFLRSQPTEKRLVFMRRYWFADSVREIAARYHISESKIKTMLFRMRGELRTYLESEGIWL